MNFTREQKLALMKDRHLAVTANAGSGKTSVLVEKYIDLLINKDKRIEADKSKISIRSIVAITFTRQAASDMKAKITRKITEMLLDEAKTPSELKTLKNLRESISSAKVSTIHSYCNNLLRDYPIEAGISPVFREMDDFESNTLTHFSVDQVLEKYSEALLNESSDEIEEESLTKFANLIDNLGIKTLREYLVKLLSEPVTLDSLLDFYQKESTEIAEIYKDNYFKSIYSKSEDYVAFLWNCLKSYQGELKQFKEAESILEELKNLNTESSEEKINYLYQIYGKFRTLKNEKKLLINSIVDEFYEVSSKIGKSYKDGIKEFADSKFDLDTANIQTLEYIENVKFLVELASEANILFNEEKEELSAYTFDDLLILTNKLLSDNQVRDKIIKDISYLLVDEFQDTNHIQYDIVSKLTPGLFDPVAKLSPKVFIVGDAKQSIYGFRSADVSVFLKAIKDIKNSNTYHLNKKKISNKIKIQAETIEANQEESVGNLALADTFRLLPGVAMFVNYVCQNIFDEKTSGIKYEPLICGRKDSTTLVNNSEITAKSGSVRFLITIKKKKNNEDEEIYENETDISSETEQTLVVKYIQKLVRGETDIVIKRNNEYVKPEYKDIAILSRTKKGLQKLMFELTKNKIPYSLSSGSGFYQTPEVTDFISLLSFLINQKDDISFASILKSPFFNFTDAELLEISINNGESLYTKFLIYESNTPEDNFLVIRAKHIINELIELSKRLPLSELLVRIIEITDYFGAIMKYEQNVQIKSNVKQLIKNAATFEGKGYNGLYDFVIRVKSLSEFSSEPEAPFISGENLVKLMTIHSSKGLEFPIVILTNTNAQRNISRGLIKSKNLGFSIPIKEKNITDNGKIRYFKSESIPNLVIKDFNSKDESDEEARLLYVAMTRAKDHLIISGEINQTKDAFTTKSGSVLSRILDGMKSDINELMLNDNIRLISKLKFTENNETLQLILPVGIITETNINFNNELDSGNEYDNLGLKKAHNQTREFENQIIQTGKIEPDNKFDIVSATKINTYLNDINQFNDRYILGLSEKYENDLYITFDDNDIKNEIDTENNISGAGAGTIIHKVLENINLWLDSILDGDTTVLENLIDKILFESSNNFDKFLKKRIMDECNKISQSEEIILHRENLKHSEFEKILNMPFEGSLLNGSIDLLLLDENKNFVEIWDWKSNIVQNKEQMIELGNHYKPQMQFYIYLISKIYPELEVYKSRLLFTRLAGNKDWTFVTQMTKSELIKYEKELNELVKYLKAF